MKICAFTGPRLYKLPWSYKEKGYKFRKLKKSLTNEILYKIKEGYNYFISGMAIGIDILCAKIILNIKKRPPNIKLECAIPCRNQTNNWDTYNTTRYNDIVSKSDIVTYVSDCSYYNGCMFKRNKYMVNKADLIIAVYNNTGGGTKQTIDYAKSINKEVVIINY